MIKIYHNYNGIFNTSKFMEDILKKQQKISFSGAGASHKNGSEDRNINMLVTMTSTMVMHAALRYYKNTLSTDFGQC